MTRKPTIKKKPVKKPSRAERDQRSMMRDLEQIRAHLHILDSAEKRSDKTAEENRIAARVAGLEEKVDRILELAERDRSAGNMIEEKISRIEWVHLMLAKVIVPLMRDGYSGLKTASIPPHVMDQIRQMGRKAEKAGIDA